MATPKKRKRPVSPPAARETVGAVQVELPVPVPAEVPAVDPLSILGGSSPEAAGHCGFELLSDGRWYEASPGEKMCGRCGKVELRPGETVVCGPCSIKLTDAAEESHRDVLRKQGVRFPGDPLPFLDYLPRGDGTTRSPVVRTSRYSEEQEVLGQQLARYFGDEPKPRRFRGGD